MKILCDVCDEEEASLFCSADEAALCNGCDRRVHCANKLASKHLRFSLVQPNCKQAPLCDICKERRAFLFCQEDRAILCIECDLPIHKANEHTQKHNRFLLTGIKLSASSSLNSTSSNIAENRSSQSSRKKPRRVSNENFSSPSVETPTPSPVSYKNEDNYVSDTASMSTSSISKYLIETLPGWRVDEFLDPSPAANGICKIGDSFSTFRDQDLQSSTSSFPLENFPSWAPEIVSESNRVPFYLPQGGFTNCIKKSTEAYKLKVTQKWPSNDPFAVPEISPPSLMNHRHIW